MRSVSFFLFSSLQLLFYFLLAFGACCCIVFTVLIFSASRDLPKLPDPLSRIIEIPPTEIYGAGGELLTSLGGRESISLDRVSPDFLNAVVATEDHRFFQHHGINKLRTVKALFITLFKPGEVQGASTITQQLAKNLFFSFEQSYLRKFKELLIALQIEATSSKREILQAYINQIYFGAGAQGVEKASQVFFGKSAADLLPGEAALLAGLPKSPTRYNPYRHYDRALQRRRVVLNRMVDVGYLTELDAKKILAETPQLHSDYADSRTGSYFLDTLIGRLVEKYGEEVVFHGGIKVYSTLDSSLQAAAESAMVRGMARLDKLMGLANEEGPKPQGALVSVDTASGAVKAMVGGRNYYKTEFNRAVNSRRQPGSGFKPFLYYTALENLGLHGASMVNDTPVSIDITGAPSWQPRNFARRNKGRMILKNALTHSVNTIAAKLVSETGPAPVIATAEKCGIKSPLDDVLSVALGTSGVTCLEMASAFSTFASGGVRHEPFFVWRVEDAFGRVVEEHLVQEERVLDPETTFQTIDMMASVIDTGSGRSIRSAGFTRPAAGKTGTTDNYNDAWFTGFTPSLSTSVWTGFDKRKMLTMANGVGITGGRSAAPIWADFMEEALAGQPERKFKVPSGIRFETADPETGCAVGRKSEQEGVDIPLKENQSLCRGEE
ncbi:MAG: PBP1A family penicillin-binding protein [Desulfobacteraceae bacterium]